MIHLDWLSAVLLGSDGVVIGSFIGNSHDWG